ncbi:protein kinase [Spirillospora sp. NPDC048911]|uniref:protein kinase domain-containing protein n=1 Tax=Spirillospora sp. NPDC048911 TaxID=3364527 RepID=UPI003723F9C0
MPDPAPLQPGDPDRVGVYRLLGCLGSGGQGVVYLGESPTGERVAIKVLHVRLSGDPRARDRFVREIDASRRVSPFCTARVLDVDTSGDRPYVVSEYVDGVSLARLVMDEGPRDPGALQRLAIATLTALVAIHQAGIVHRDFKPGNVLCGPDGPRVIDFGIARVLDATTMQTTGALGTPAFMSPEQILAGDVGAPSDMFSWAATMAYAALGRSLFGNDNIAAVTYRILNEPPDLGVAMGEPLRGLLTACLAKEPGERPTAQQALLSLLGQDGAEPVTQQPASEPVPVPALAVAELSAERGRSKHPHRLTVLLAAMGTLVVLAIPVGAYLVSNQGDGGKGGSSSGSGGPTTAGPLKVTASLVRTLKNHTSNVETVRFGLDGKAFCSSTYNGTVRLWKNALQGPSAVIAQQSRPYFSMAYSPDGKYLAASSDPTVELLDVKRRRVAGTFSGHTGRVFAVAYGPDGKTVASGGEDKTLRLWNADTKESIATFKGHKGPIESVAYSPDGKTLATASHDKTVRLWDIESKASKFTLKEHTDKVFAVGFSPDGKTLVTGGGGTDHTVRLWDPSNGKALAKLDGHSANVESVPFSPDGRLLATGGHDGKVILWDVAARRKLATLTDHTGRIYSVAFNPDGTLLASGGNDRTVRIYRLTRTP